MALTLRNIRKEGRGRNYLSASDKEGCEEPTGEEGTSERKEK